MKQLCSKCSNREVHARGLCRSCYDKSRTYLSIGIAKSIEDDFNALKEEKGWSSNRTCNHLMMLGFKFIKKQKEWLNE